MTIIKIVNNYSIDIPYIDFNEKRLKFRTESCDGVVLWILENDIMENGTLVFPEGAKYIAPVQVEGKNIIQDSTCKLKRLVIPPNFLSFGDFTFAEEKNLQELIITSDNYLNFGNYSFECCGLSNLNLNRAINIGECAFAANHNLKDISIEEIYNMEGHTFQGCSNLENVYIGSNPHYCQGANFAEDPNLKSMTVGYGFRLVSLLESTYETISNECFENDLPFKITYLYHMDKLFEEYGIDELEQIICKLARRQFFQIDGYSFTSDGILTYGPNESKTSENVFPKFIIKPKRINKHVFYLRLIFPDKKEITVPIKGYLTKQTENNEFVKQLILKKRLSDK